MDEIKRSAKLVNANLSLHGPLVEASGVGERGYTEENRIGAEKQIESAVLRSHQLDPKGNISVTLHSTAQLPEMTPKIITEKGKEDVGLYVINTRTGQIGAIQPQERYFDEKKIKEEGFTGEKIPFKPLEELEKRNEEQWSQQLAGINRYASYGEQAVSSVKRALKEEGEEFHKAYDFITQGGDMSKLKLNVPEEMKLKAAEKELTSGRIYLREAYREMKTLIDDAWAAAEKSDNKKDKEKIKKFIQDVSPSIVEGIEKSPRYIEQLGEVVEKGLRVLGNMEKTPEVFKPLNDFVVEKSAQTFGNVAMTAYEKIKDKNTLPLINIENPPFGGGLSSAEDLKKVVIESRKKFQENLVKNGVSKSEAEKIAEKTIGATWDVGHINMMRKKGYSEKDVVAQTKIIAPYVKHVHLSDNFGLDHTELPMGMGNVPLDKMMKELKQAGFKGEKVIEAGNWWQYFAEQGGGSPFKPSIENFDSPMYSMYAGPTWSQSGVLPGYYMGPSPTNPPIHHATYGSKFQTLPLELGGEIPGGQSRFSGTPNQ